MATQLENKKIITLDSTVMSLSTINSSLQEQNIQLINQLLIGQKSLHQLRIHNMYKAHENDFNIDDNIFENDEIN
jgi:hypothetical protein